MRPGSTSQQFGLIAKLLLLLGLLSLPREVCAQGGGPGNACTPIKVDLRGRPSGVYDTAGLVRSSKCCGSNSCVQFDVHLDPQAIAFKVELFSGAIPGGSLTYQIDCSGNPQFPGNTVCVSNKDSFTITFCKPGNNPNGYRIISKKKPEVLGDSVVYDGCSGLMIADSFKENTIQWRSVANNPFYDSLLSCTSGCDSTRINLLKGFPDSIQYQVSGIPDYQCAKDTVYDTLTVRLRDSLKTRIKVVNDTLPCPGQPDSGILMAKPSGGSAPYHYEWNTGDTTQTISTDTGEYWVSVTDSAYCGSASDTFRYKVSKAVDPKAGDTIICPDSARQLGGTPILNADSSNYRFRWIPGKGLTDATRKRPLANPNTSTTYMLQVTDTNGCQFSDTTAIIQHNFSSKIKGPPVVCAYSKSYQYWIHNCDTSNRYSWEIKGGGIVDSSKRADTINIEWYAGDTVQLSVKAHESQRCDTSLTKTIYIQSVPKVSINGPDTPCAFQQGHVYNVPAKQDFRYNWNVSGGTIVRGQNEDTVNVKWGAAGPGILSLDVKDTISGCTNKIYYSTYAKFDFNYDNLAHATFGKDAKQYDSAYYSDGEGPLVDSNCRPGRGIDLVIDGSQFNKDEICMTYRFQRDEDNGKFFNRGFTEIYMQGGTIYIQYRIDNGSGGYTDLGPFNTGYSVPYDNTFRNFTFCYDKETGKFTFTVNGKLIWSNNGPDNRALNWTGAGDAVMGQKMDGTCRQRAFWDFFSFYKPLSIRPKPDAAIKGRDTVCHIGDTLTYTAKSNTGSSSRWRIPKGGTIVNGQSTDTVNVKWDSTGQGILQLIQTNKAGCDTVVKDSVTVSQLPSPQIQGKDTVCAFTANHLYHTTAKAGHQYRWTIANGQIQTLANRQQVKVKWLKAGQGTLKLIQTNPIGCKANDQQIVTINAKPKPLINAN